MGLFNFMENDSVKIIKKTEEEAEKQIEEKKIKLEKARLERTDFWQNKEKALEAEYSEKEQNILLELKGPLKQAEDKILKDCGAKKYKIKKIAESNYKAFEREVLERL